MKQAIYYGIKDVRVEEVHALRPRAGEVKVRVKYCGICGSDLHEYLHGPFPQSVFGHEACGEITEKGPAVQGFQVGDRVIAFTKGAFAEFLVCPPERLLRIPADMDWKRAAVVEPLAGAADSLERGGVLPDDAVLIAGAGPVGLMVLLGLKALGVEKVYVTDISAGRREKARELGATDAADPLEKKIPAWIREATGGRGVDVAVEAVGVEATLKDCLASVRFKGKVIVQGIFTDRVPIHMLGFVTRETAMIGTNSINPPLALKWIRERGVQPEAIVTRIIPLDQIVSAGFEPLTAKIKSEIKILVEP